jgi:hypothetical protein
MDRPQPGTKQNIQNVIATSKHEISACPLVSKTYALCTILGIDRRKTTLKESSKRKLARSQSGSQGRQADEHVGVASLEADAELLEQGGATLGPRVARAVSHSGRKRMKEAGGGGAKAANAFCSFAWVKLVPISKKNQT